MNPSWMLMPVGNLLGAVAARKVDPDYIEWGWFLFSIGSLVWIALWPLTFRRVKCRFRMELHDYVGVFCG